MTLAKNVKAGDIVNGHDEGWLKVINVKKKYGFVHITYQNGKEIECFYDTVIETL